MELLEHTIEISATPAEVYNVLTDTSLIIKIFRDAVSVVAEPPGRSVVGQKYRMVGRVGRRKIDILLQVTELVPESKIVTTQIPGGIFKSFRQCTILKPWGTGTECLTTFEYELSLGYIGKVLNAVLVERLIRENLEAYSDAVKELSELLPMPPA